MHAEGIQFKTGVRVGSDEWPAGKLIEDHDAVVLCTGATWPRDINIPGFIFYLSYLISRAYFGIRAQFSWYTLCNELP